MARTITVWRQPRKHSKTHLACVAIAEKFFKIFLSTKWNAMIDEQAN
jgi:hypothetical protein